MHKNKGTPEKISEKKVAQSSEGVHQNSGERVGKTNTYALPSRKNMQEAPGGYRRDQRRAKEVKEGQKFPATRAFLTNALTPRNARKNRADKEHT